MRKWPSIGQPKKAFKFGQAVVQSSQAHSIFPFDLFTIQFICNLDEYTRITTPRSDVLFKKGYLSRPKKSDMTSPVQSASTSSNDSAVVSVTSSDEAPPYYRMQSISPENCSTIASSPNYSVDGFEQDLPIMYSSGFYDGNGYFYANRTYINNNNSLVTYAKTCTQKKILFR